VVRRLVEQKHVDTAQENGGKRRPRGLPSRKRVETALEPGAEPELRERLLRAGLEVPAAAREERVERLAVRLGERRLVSEPRGERVHPVLRLRDAGAAREIPAQRLAGLRVALLREE